MSVPTREDVGHVFFLRSAACMAASRAHHSGTQGCHCDGDGRRHSGTHRLLPNAPRRRDITYTLDAGLNGTSLPLDGEATFAELGILPSAHIVIGRRMKSAPR